MINNVFDLKNPDNWDLTPGQYKSYVNDSVTTYEYDAMNRQTVSREEQTQKIGLDPKATTIVTTLTHNYAYDLAGNRVSDLAREQTSGKALQETVNNYVYDDLHRLDSFSISQSGKATQSGQVLYDGAGRQVYAKTLSSTGEAEHRYNQYDTLGRVQDTRVVMRRADNQQKIQHTDVAYHGAPGTTDPSLGYDAAGNLRGQVQTTNGNTGDATRTTYKYQFNGSYQQIESTTTQGGRTATTNTWRDANGFISNIEQRGGVNDNRYNRAFVNDAKGNALYVNQGTGQFAAPIGEFGRIENRPGGYLGGYIGNVLNPGHIQRQLVANGEVLARYGDAPDSENPPKAGDVPKYVNTAEFHLNAPALKLRDTNFSAMSYTVVGGETLKTIARNVLGDSSLWWRIADANGLAVSGDGELTAGQTLSIPKLALNANNADTFQPYDPSRVTGSLDSVLPAPAGQGGGCGALGKIIMVAVAVVVSALSAGTLGPAMAGALGSIASQATGNLLGVQDGFSWKSVALSALSAGLANNLPLPDLGSAWQNAAVRMGTVNALTQGIGVVTGLQDRFDWKSVAASAAGGAVGSYVGEQLKGSTMFNDWSKTAADFARGTIRGFAAGTAAAIAQGGRISIQQVATDAFGNALGENLASLNQPTSSIYSLASDDRASLGLLPGNGEPNLRLGGAAGLSYGEQRAIPSFGINTQNLENLGNNGYLASMYATPRIIYQGVNSQGLRYDYYDSDVRATEVISHNILKPVALPSISLDNAPTFNTDISVASPSGAEYIQGAAQLVLGGTYNQTVRIGSALASIPYAILSGVDTAVGVQNILQTNYSYTPDSPGAEAILGKLAPTVAYIQSNIINPTRAFSEQYLGDGVTSILGAGLQAGAEIYGTVTGLRTVGSLATTAWSNVSIGPLSGSRAAQLGGVKFGDTKARVWGSAEAPRLVPFSANDVSASVGKNGGWGEIHVNIEGQRVQFGIIEHTADGPQFMLDKTTTLQSGEVVKLHGRGFTNIAIQKTIAAYKETFGAAPSSLPGSLALENLANFQTEFAAAQGVVRDVAAAGQMAINRTSFGSARVAAGYGNFSIDMANFGDVFIGGKTLSNAPRSVIIRARPN